MRSERKAGKGGESEEKEPERTWAGGKGAASAEVFGRPFDHSVCLPTQREWPAHCGCVQNTEQATAHCRVCIYGLIHKYYYVYNNTRYYDDVLLIHKEATPVSPQGHPQEGGFCSEQAQHARSEGASAAPLRPRRHIPAAQSPLRRRIQKPCWAGRAS